MTSQHNFIVFLFFIITIVIVTCSNNIIKVIDSDSNSGSSDSGSESSNSQYNYISSTVTNLELSKVCPSDDSIDYYRIGQCIEGYMYSCDIYNQNVLVSSFDDFTCEILNSTNTYPIGCSTNSNSNLTTYYNCVEDITPTPSSYIITTFNAHQCDKTHILHQRFVKLDNCGANMYPIIYGSCNSTYYSYTFYNTTSCETPIYEMADALNVCIDSDVFNESYLSQCI
ncbi:hypothetical protein RB653_000147 [Dictyostelium firmibasis]|uniref:Uncharacterized protein n=1 Tax=Dictyostelium firmibasis TaxID=79012 RepID=A0AAN7TUP5_9MYCE